jgi:uncharacterized protein (TIGR02757 family)
MTLQNMLDNEVLKRNSSEELSELKPDPLMIAREQTNELAILTCALFAYGNANQIVKFLKKLPFDLFDRPVNESIIRNSLKGLKYRFQSEEDIVQWFLICQRIRQEEKNLQVNKDPKKSLLKNVFINSYNKDVIIGIHSLITLLKNYSNGYTSPGFEFLIGSINGKGPLKRWNMFLRWLVRKDNLDLGWWQEVGTDNLIIPLDVHTFNLGLKLGLLTRKTYDLKAAIELTDSLKNFDSKDPVKYDFAIYRLGQEKSIFID